MSAQSNQLIDNCCCDSVEIADVLRSPVIENLKLEESSLSASSGISESSENEDENDIKQPRAKNRSRQKIAKNSKNQEETTTPHEPPAEETQLKLIKQLEFYFSDENITKDQFLLKHVRQNKSGYVSLKLLGTFRKIQKMSKDWRDMRYALTRQKKNFDKSVAAQAVDNDHEALKLPSLQLNSRGTKVRRVKPLPDWDETVHDRTILVFNYQTILKADTSPIEAVTEYFSENKQNTKNEVALVRLTTPGKKLPDDLRPYLKIRPEIANKPCALVEFKTIELAQRALLTFNGANDWRGLQVLPLATTEKRRRVVEDQSNNQHQKHGVNKGGLSSSLKSDSILHHDSNPNNSPGSPKQSRCRLAHPGSNSPHVQNRLPFKSIPQNKEAGRHCFDRSPCSTSHPNDYSPLSCSPSSLGNRSGSPWLRRKMMLGSSNDLSASSKDANLVTVIRQPRGPDNTRGFSGSLN